MDIEKQIKPIRVGDSRLFRVNVRFTTNDAPVDVSGDKFIFTVKDSKDTADADAALQYQVTAPSGTLAQGGTVLMKVPKESTSPVKVGSYYYDITWLSVVSDPGGKYVVQQGGVSFVQPVTRAQS